MTDDERITALEKDMAEVLPGGRVATDLRRRVEDYRGDIEEESAPNKCGPGKIHSFLYVVIRDHFECSHCGFIATRNDLDSTGRGRSDEKP